jgi:hypothetical protein
MRIEVLGRLKNYMLRVKRRSGRRFAPSYFRRAEALRFHRALSVRCHLERSRAPFFFRAVYARRAME